jgi:hypothetical protein
MALRRKRRLIYGKRVGCVAAILAVAFTVPLSAVATDPLQELLDRTSRQVSASLELISEMNCTEHVTQAKLGDRGQIIEKEESSYDYLILLSNTGGELNLVESRIADHDGKSASREKAPLLLSNGFSTMFLIFHAYYAAGFEFSGADQESLGGRTLAKVHFRHIQGTRSPAALAVRGREYPLDLSGTAWIDPATGIIAKIEGTLETGMEDVGLRTLQFEVDYAPVAFQGPAQAYWLPAQATVEVESRHQHWRNTHVFTGYKRFSVDTKEQIAKP